LCVLGPAHAAYRSPRYAASAGPSSVYELGIDAIGDQPATCAGLTGLVGPVAALAEVAPNPPAAPIAATAAASLMMCRAHAEAVRRRGFPRQATGKHVR
jgi:hypothetical protein